MAGVAELQVRFRERGFLTLRMGDMGGLSDPAGPRLSGLLGVEAFDGDVGRSTLLRTSFVCTRWHIFDVNTIVDF